MQDIKIEDTVILLDTSRSMLRKFSPGRTSRLEIAIQATKRFIKTKFMIDPKDRVSLVSFGKNVRKLTNYTYDENEILRSLKKIQISGRGNLLKAIAFSLQTSVQEMRKIGGKVQRIFIITDNKLNTEQTKIEKIIKIAKGLGVYIDICQLGRISNEKEEVLKRMAQTTKGEYGYFKNTKALINAGAEFASKKEIKTSTDFYAPEKKDKTPPLVSEIALPLRRPSLMEIRLMMSRPMGGEDKCAICHSIKAPLTDADFYTEGRYCPNCDRPIHLSCSAMWAKKSEFKENIFRCPFCFFLLRLPKSAQKIIESIDLETSDVKILEDIDLKKTNMIEIHETNIEQIDASCSYCYNIFLGDYKVFKCGNCGSYYHEPCLKKMYNEMKACRFCGAEISS